MPPTRLPPLLQPYLYPARDSLTLLTGVLGAGTNWLLVRYICAALSGNSRAKKRGDALADGIENNLEGQVGFGENEEVAVVLVSWMRDWEFWRTECRRSGGLDLARLAQQKRFAFIDGLTRLYLPETPATNASSQNYAEPSRPKAPTPRQPPVSFLSPTSTQNQRTNPSIYLTAPSLSHLLTTITTTLTALSTPSSPSNSTILLLDAPDLLLATAPPSTPITPTSLLSTLLTLRSNTYALLLTLSADLPLLSPSSTQLSSNDNDAHHHHQQQQLSASKHTPLETAHAALLVTVAHMADTVVSLRGLETGVAADVSGVLRVSCRDEVEEDGVCSVEQRGRKEKEREKEVLYRVLGDGGVRVFERGAESGGGG